MFIKKLYHYNKAVCVSFLGFIILFAVINYKWGMVATPVLQYGMYSSVFHTTDTQTVFIVEANNKMISSSEISLTERDVLQVYLENYEKERSVNEAAYQTMKKYIAYTGLAGYMKVDKYRNGITDSIFSAWYKTKVEKITGTPVHSLNVYRQHFLWKETKLQPADTLIKLTYIGT